MKIKVEFNKEISKYSFQSLDNLCYAELNSFVSGAYGLKDFTLKYVDEDDDHVKIFSDETLRNAFEEMDHLRIFVCKSVSGSNANATNNNRNTKQPKRPPQKMNVAAPKIVSFRDLQIKRRMELEQNILEKLKNKRAIHNVPSFLNPKSRAIFKVQKKDTRSIQNETAEFNTILLEVDLQGDLKKNHWNSAYILREVQFRLYTVKKTLTEVQTLRDKQTMDNIESIDAKKKSKKTSKNKCSIVDTVCKNVKQNVQHAETILLKLTQLEAQIKGRLHKQLKIRRDDGTAVTYQKKKDCFFTQGTATVVKDQKVLEWYEDLLKRMKRMKEEQQQMIDKCKTVNEWKTVNKRANKKLEYNERKRIQQNQRNERNRKRKISEDDVHASNDILDAPRPFKRVRHNDKG